RRPTNLICLVRINRVRGARSGVHHSDRSIQCNQRRLLVRHNPSFGYGLFCIAGWPPHNREAEWFPAKYLAGFLFFPPVSFWFSPTDFRRTKFASAFRYFPPCRIRCLSRTKKDFSKRMA